MASHAHSSLIWEIININDYYEVKPWYNLCAIIPELDENVCDCMQFHTVSQ